MTILAITIIISLGCAFVMKKDFDFDLTKSSQPVPSKEISECPEIEQLPPALQDVPLDQLKGLIPADRADYDGLPAVSEEDFQAPNDGGLIPADRDEYNSLPEITEKDIQKSGKKRR